MPSAPGAAGVSGESAQSGDSERSRRSAMAGAKSDCEAGAAFASTESATID